MALITAAEARLYIPGLTGTNEDTKLDTVIAAVGAQISAHLGFPARNGVADLEDQAYTVYIDAPGGRMLTTPIFPFVSVTSIHDDPTHAYGSAYLVDSGDYTEHGDEGLIELTATGSKGSWSVGPRNIKLVYTAGYATVPADLKQACGLQVAHVWRNRETVGKSSYSIEGASVSISKLALLPEVKEIVRPYRLPHSWVG